MTVLIVDDVTLLRILLKDILTKHCGLTKEEVFEASGGFGAVREYKKLRPAVVFLDVLMPDQSGVETVKEIVKINPDAHIVMCSAAAEKNVVRECIQSGAKDYILKPLDPERVKKALSKYENWDEYVKGEKPGESLHKKILGDIQGKPQESEKDDDNDDDDSSITVTRAVTRDID